VRRPFRLLPALALAWLAAAPAAAQETRPIGRYVIDARGSFVHFGRDVQLANSRSLKDTDLSSRGFGFEVGGHVYFARWKAVTFGAGANLLVSGANHDAVVVNGTPTGPNVRTRFRALTPQLSFNFGGRDGWSYISGGIGRSHLTLERAEDTLDDPRPGLKTINYGGGARWFTGRHLAFAADLRFYAMAPRPPDGDLPSNPRLTWIAINVGVAVR
jgi:hypothetical protein